VLYDSDRERLKPPAPLTAATKLANDYVGTYALYDLNLKIRNDEDSLWLVPSGQKQVKLVPLSDDEFLLDGSNGASSLVFHRNAGGTVTCLSLLDQNGTTFWRNTAAR